MKLDPGFNDRKLNVTLGYKQLFKSLWKIISSGLLHIYMRENKMLLEFYWLNLYKNIDI